MDNRKATIEYIFKKYGKENTINWINAYFTDRINNNMTIDKCIYILDCYNILNNILNKYELTSYQCLIEMGLIK